MRDSRKCWPLVVPDTPAPWRPLADVYRTNGSWLLKFDLAGVRLEDVTVAVRGRCVTVSGFRKDLAVEEGSSYYSMEISYNRFERTIEIPVSLENARISLQAEDGILLVRMNTEGNEHVR
jgi:HSP20 family protein